ncbi:MerR family transcriptional regulator [Enterobacter oligotrophicus]|uniref:MerR family transcriptional regulator n=1 Tax=Enterobacter TaxID=547 RepID=UPI001C00FB4A|nr:MerR family transcriptional regulator [Enterobacter oligotrophicus]ELW1645306.1 MerR family transcriptional regulator [Enterobacter oligotrophicus]MBT9424697.1 MerR family transcriptional regulator [Enterobacter oligotrophicus]
MRPSDLAKLTGVSNRVLRHYESKGLIRSRRLNNGYRDYDPKEAEKVKWVISLIKCGFSTRQIAELEKFSQISDMDDDRFIMCLEQHRNKLQALDTLIELLNERRNALAARIHSYE